MPPSEDAIRSVMVSCLHTAIRRMATRMLNAEGAMSAVQFHDVERLMRLAAALARNEAGDVPRVHIHKASVPVPGQLPELLPVDVTDLLAARAADQIVPAIEGDASARAAIERLAEILLRTEDVQSR